ncbi:glycosyltransferase [Flavobacteriaceae bacterium]|nr:glycosyltransferase [Flavobacteriaceae bacterium]
MNIPKVSVIMPVYNAEKYLNETINSILNQTYGDFEFLIIDDGSTDRSFQILESYTDPRIKLLKNDQNIGYVKTLNKLIELSTGEYIARQDNDDISFPKRLEKQVRFLDRNQDIGICGTNALIFGKINNISFFPVNDEEIRAFMLFNSPICHPTAMLRKSLFIELDVKYDESFCPAEDYALWFKLSKKTKIANLSKILLKYRVHDKNTSTLNINAKTDNANRLRIEMFKRTLSMKVSLEEIQLLSLNTNRELINYENLMSFENFLKRILRKNEEIGYYNQRVLRNLLFYFWTVVCFKIPNISRTKKLKIYLSSILYNNYSLLNFISIRSIRKVIYERSL